MCENVERKQTAAIILAAGLGTRVGGTVTKQRISLCGHTVLWHTLRAFQHSSSVDEIILVVRECEREEILRDIGDEFTKIKRIVNGGNCRAESARLGFSAISDDVDTIAIHDGARCLITPSDIERVISAAKDCGAATAASAVVDTVKRVGGEGFITETLDRDSLRCAQTPQAFARDIYAKALEACKDSSDITDDNMLVEAIGVPVLAVLLNDENKKITTPGDLDFAEFVIMKRSKGYV